MSLRETIAKALEPLDGCIVLEAVEVLDLIMPALRAAPPDEADIVRMAKGIFDASQLWIQEQTKPDKGSWWDIPDEILARAAYRALMEG